MADRYWVGGTANWNATAGSKWSTTSGGASGAAVPTAADDVFFDANSGAGTTTVGSSFTAVCRSLNFTGYTGTFTYNASTSALTIGDGTAGASNIALKLVSGMTYTAGSGGAVTFVSTSGTQQTVDFASKTLNAVTFNGAGGSWLVSGAPTTGALTLTAGTLTLGSATCSSFASSNTNTRALVFGTNALVTCTGNWDCTTSTNLTVTPGSGTTIYFNTGSVAFHGGGKSWPALETQSAASVDVFEANTFASILHNSSGTMSLKASNTITGSLGLSQGTLGIEASQTMDSFVSSNFATRTVTYSNTPTLTVTSSDLGGYAWNAAIGTGLTVTNNSAVINLTGNGVNHAGGGKDWGTVRFTQPGTNFPTATTAVNSPSLAMGADVVPTTVNATTAVNSPTLSMGVDISATTVTATSAIASPTVTVGSSAEVSPAVVSATTTVPAPTPSAGADVAPSTVSATTTVDTPALAMGATVSAGAVNASTAVNAPTLAMGVSLSPAVVLVTTTVPAPDAINTASIGYLTLGETVLVSLTSGETVQGTHTLSES
jgi:hypothetical protein